MGYTLNLMSLGLSLVVGILVDDAIVVWRIFIGTWKWAKTKFELPMMVRRNWWNCSIDYACNCGSIYQLH
jgi:hypothetical protein